MTGNTKTLKLRIKSVDSTLHLTKAMGLVASSKMRKANLAMSAGRQYESAVQNVVDLLTAAPECQSSPFMREFNEGGKTRLIVIAGDRGLAGGYNANVFRTVRDFGEAEIIPIGKRACERYGNEIVSSEKFYAADAFRLAKELCEQFKNGEYDRLGIVTTNYISMMTQTPDIKWVLPLSKNENTQNTAAVFEPDELTILDIAVPEYLSGVIIACIRESFASEVAARRMAMDSAGKNAQQMIDELQLEYNRARQGAITQEITEIVAGSGN
ncbi:MAG: ATP synthase F1 subunit gamma [Clostridia bacterium]|nr:ATP synthase F1 subunit gamma [Clostridia bacterium]